MGEKHSEQTTGTAPDEGTAGSPKKTGGGFASEIGSMLQDAEKKGAKGAFLSRLKKTQIGKVNLGPDVGDFAPLQSCRGTMNAEHPSRRDERR